MKEMKNLSFHKRLGFAVKGLKNLWKTEKSFKTQVAVAIGLLIFCLVVRPSYVWCGLFLMATALVLSLEIINSGIESLIDRLHPEYDQSIGLIKDSLAGAVLVASFSAILLFAIFLVSFFTESI
jgi:undecaprenol kinase